MLWKKGEPAIPAFGFTNTPDENRPSEYTHIFITSNENTASPERPILLLGNRSRKWNHHSNGVFTNPVKRTPSGLQEEDGTFNADIPQIDTRLVNLLQQLGENYTQVRLSGRNWKDGYVVYKIRRFAFGKGTKLSAEDGFPQFMMDRLFASSTPEPEQEGEEPDELGDHTKLTSLQSISDFMTCADRTIPDNIRFWTRRNLAVARSHEMPLEEKRHAQRALFVMINTQWKNNYFESIDPVKARQILDEELYGMEQAKQRIIETIVQINRTHTLSAYGLLLAGPTGTGKSQIAYAVVHILRLPWAILDMNSINDPEQLTDSSRIYANVKLGIIMKAFSMAGESNLAFIINELDKAAAGKGNGNPADVLLALLDNLGFTDNYIECMVPTAGVYPIAITNDKSKVNAPLVSHFAVIDILDCTPEEKKIIFSNHALSKVLACMGMREQECTITEDGLEAFIDQYRDTSGIRDLEQAAEHIVANTLYQIEVDHVDHVVFNAGMMRELLG